MIAAADSIFDQMDIDGTGFIDAAQLQTAIDRATAVASGAMPSFDSMDANRDGVVARSEFAQAMSIHRTSHVTPSHSPTSLPNTVGRDVGSNGDVTKAVTLIKEAQKLLSPPTSPKMSPQGASQWSQGTHPQPRIGRSHRGGSPTVYESTAGGNNKSGSIVGRGPSLGSPREIRRQTTNQTQRGTSQPLRSNTLPEGSSGLYAPAKDPFSPQSVSPPRISHFGLGSEAGTRSDSRSQVVPSATTQNISPNTTKKIGSRGSAFVGSPSRSPSLVEVNFDDIDINRDGYIDRDEFDAYVERLKQAEFNTYYKEQDISSARGQGTASNDKITAQERYAGQKFDGFGEHPLAKRQAERSLPMGTTLDDASYSSYGLASGEREAQVDTAGNWREGLDDMLASAIASSATGTTDAPGPVPDSDATAWLQAAEAEYRSGKTSTGELIADSKQADESSRKLKIAAAKEQIRARKQNEAFDEAELVNAAKKEQEIPHQATSCPHDRPHESVVVKGVHAVEGLYDSFDSRANDRTAGTSNETAPEDNAMYVARKSATVAALARQRAAVQVKEYNISGGSSQKSIEHSGEGAIITGPSDENKYAQCFEASEINKSSYISTESRLPTPTVPNLVTQTIYHPSAPGKLTPAP